MGSAKRNKNVRRSSVSRQLRRKASSRIPSRPFVAATLAMTVDGKTTTRNFTPVDFTSREDKLHLFRQRALADAVLIGHTSLKRDNVRLGIPLELQKARGRRGQTPAPIRIIVSNKGKIDNRLNIFQTSISPIVIFSTKRMPQKYQQALAQKAILHLSDAEHVDLAAALHTLRDKYKIRTVACEGGPTLFRSLLERGLVDRLNLTIDPYMFGAAKAPTWTGLRRKFLPASLHWYVID